MASRHGFSVESPVFNRRISYFSQDFFMLLDSSTVSMPGRAPIFMGSRTSHVESKLAISDLRLEFVCLSWILRVRSGRTVAFPCFCQSLSSRFKLAILHQLCCLYSNVSLRYRKRCRIIGPKKGVRRFNLPRTVPPLPFETNSTLRSASKAFRELQVFYANGLCYNSKYFLSLL